MFLSRAHFILRIASGFYSSADFVREYKFVRMVSSDNIWIYLILLACSIVFLWSNLRRQYSYWKHNGVPFVPATLFLGNLKPICFCQTTTALHFDDIYNDSRGKDSPVIGIHLFLKPALIVKDLDLIRTMLIKDFASFSNRLVECK